VGVWDWGDKEIGWNDSDGEIERSRDREIERWRDGESVGDREIGRWGDGFERELGDVG
jgi:hypothetical protein